MTNPTQEARAREIAREAIALKKDADGAVSTAAGTRAGNYDDTGEVQDAYRGALLAFSQVPADRDTLCRLIEKMLPETDEHTGIPVGRQVEALADAILSLTPKSAGDDGDMVLGGGDDRS